MKPLSIVYFIINSRKKVIPVFLSICLGVFMMYTLSLIADQYKGFLYDRWLRPLERYCGVMPMNKELDNDTIQKVSDYPQAKKVIPFKRGVTLTKSLLGALNEDILYVRNTDMNLIMDTFDLRLKEGRMPVLGADEILLHWRIAANKGLTLGEQVGSAIDTNEMIQGRFTVVGTIEGPCLIGIGAMKEEKSFGFRELFKYGMLVIPREGKLMELNEFLDTLPLGEVDIHCLKHASELVEESETISNVLIAIIGLMVLIVLCITLFNINYMHYYYRRKEFGILAAVGYSKKDIQKRIVSESIFISGIGFVLGISLSMLFCFLMNLIIFLPRGDELPLIKPVNMLLVMLIPVIVTMTSIRPAMRMMKNLDAISIIEGI